MEARAKALSILLALVSAGAGLALAGQPGSTSESLAMTPAVACSALTGYRQYEPLEGAALTADEKLLIYYEPLNYKIIKSGKGYIIHLSQDVQVRKRGQKEVLWSKKDLLDYTLEHPTPPGVICLNNKIALKGLGPGEYDLDIILYDRQTKAPAVRQVLRFQIKPSPPPEPAEPPKEEKGQPGRGARSKEPQR